MTEQVWRRVEPHLPPPRAARRGGRGFRDGRQVLDGIPWVLHAGARSCAPLRAQRPDRYGPWGAAPPPRRPAAPPGGATTRQAKPAARDAQAHPRRPAAGAGRQGPDRPRAVAGPREQAKPALRHRRPRRPGGGGRKKGRRVQKGAAGAKRGAGGREEPGGRALGRSRGGWGAKLHLLTDATGLPLAATLAAGQARESTRVEALLPGVRVGRPRRPRRPRPPAGDKGDSCPRVRRLLWGRGVKPAIPRRGDQLGKRGRPARFDAASHRRRNAVERRVGWLKGERRVGTRHDKLATRFLVFVQLAMMRVLLRRLRNTT